MSNTVIDKGEHPDYCKCRFCIEDKKDRPKNKQTYPTPTAPPDLSLSSKPGHSLGKGEF